jgi:hypothetical protein
VKSKIIKFYELNGIAVPDFLPNSDEATDLYKNGICDTFLSCC